MNSALVDIPQSLQDLPPKWAHFCLHIEQFISDDLQIRLNGKSIVTAFSGGIDSTALLFVLHHLAQKNGGRIIGVHLNHQLRDEAEEDAKWAESVCDALAIECVIGSENIASLAQSRNIGVEEAGRNARYELFQKVLKDHQADYIAVGHHLDDLCEDVLMRLTRGTGWPGLSGMKGFDPDRHLLRPLLLTRKSTLSAFLTDIGMKWREDASNASSAWMRNRVRKDMLPLFLKENPNFPESIARLWKIGRLEDDFWTMQTDFKSDTLSNDILEESHKALRLRLYKAALDRLGPGQALANTLFKLDKAWLEKRAGATFQFPGEKTATIVASGVVFSRSH